MTRTIRSLQKPRNTWRSTITSCSLTSLFATFWGSHFTFTYEGGRIHQPQTSLSSSGNDDDTVAQKHLGRFSPQHSRTPFDPAQG